MTSPTETKTVGVTYEANCKLLDFVRHLNKQPDLTESTKRTYNTSLRRLQRLGANLMSPDSVKEALCKIKNENTKAITVISYTAFTKFAGFSWQPPKLHLMMKIGYFPTEQEIDIMIAFCSDTNSLIIAIIKETGMRIGEVLRLKWLEIDCEHGTITLDEPENTVFRAFGIYRKN